MRIALSVLAACALLFPACGDDDAVDATDVSIVDDSGSTGDQEQASGDEDDEGEGEGRDPDALFGADVCRALVPALDGQRDGLGEYATDEVLDQLEGFGPSESAEVTEVADGCEIAIGDVWATLFLEGDGHVGQRAVSVTFDASEGGDGFDPFVEDVPAAVDEYLANPAACDGGAEPSGDLPNHEIYSLADGYVVGVICFRAAYQNVYELFGWDGIDLINLTVEQYQDGSVVESPFVTGLPDVDENSDLTNVEKGRGVGDCGVRSLWYLEDTTLVLETAWARDCDDSGEPVGPEDWPIVY